MRESNFIERARALDAGDELSGFRARFRLPANRIYLDGNSLGLLSRDAESALDKVVSDWRELGVDGWLDGRPPWFTLAEQAAGLMAPLLGASVEETAVGCSTTVNLHQLLATLYNPHGSRTQILIDANAFPSDRYAVASHLKLRGRNPNEDTVIVPTMDGFRLDEERIIDSFDETVSLALLPGVVYTTGQLLDMPRLTEAAHRAGCVIGFDCSHSAGAVPHSLSEWGIDFAFWCGYKYLNGGPGAAAGLFINRRHFGKGPGLAGWFSSDKERQFDMSDELQPARDAGALQIGTPPLLSVAPLLGSLPIIHEAGIERLRAKSLALTGFLMDALTAETEGFGFSFANPVEPERRGGHLALVHERAAGICAELKARGVIPDFRPPSIIRLAPTPLYNSFLECAEAAETLGCIMRERAYERHPMTRGMVT